MAIGKYYKSELPLNLQRVNGSTFNRISLSGISARDEGQGLRISSVGLSMWPGLFHSMVTGVQGQASERESTLDGSCITLYGLVSGVR